MFIFRDNQKEEPQISGRESVSANDGCIIEDLMQNHDVLLSGLRSRLTKLQVIFCFTIRVVDRISPYETIIRLRHLSMIS